MAARWTVETLALLIAVPLLFAAFLVVRGRLLRRHGATMTCSMRGPSAAAWRHGVCSYDGDALRWYRSLGVRLRPDLVLPRRGLLVDVRHCPVGEQSSDLEVLSCRDDDGRIVEVALTHATVPGFLAWLEAVPPQAQSTA